MSLVPPKGAGISTGVRLQMSFHSMRDEKQILKGLNGRAKGGAGSIGGGQVGVEHSRQLRS